MENNPRLKRILEQVRPKTFFEDLAEFGYLMQYIYEYMHEQFENDNEFRIKIFNILLKYSKYPSQELNYYYLWHLNHSLEQFFSEVKDA